MSLSSKTRTIIAVDLDCFYAQCEEVRNPTIKGKPVVVCVFSGRTSESGAVSTCNYVARKLGVKSGMPIVFAKRLLKDASDSVFLPMDREYYDSVSRQIMDILQLHSQRFEQVSVDEAFIDTTQFTKGDFSLAEAEARKIKNEILIETSLTCSVGVAANKLLAKLAADSKKPDGLVLIRPEDAPGFLNPLPVGKLLGVGPKTEKKMEQIGIRTVGDLASFNSETLSEQFGRNLGPQLQREAQGIDEDEVKVREHEQLSRIVTLKEDADKFNFEDVMKPLAQDIAEKLISLNSLCRSVGIKVITDELKTKNRSKTLETPINSESGILSTASSLFKSYFEEEGLGVRARRVGIRVACLTMEEDSSG